MAWSTPLTAVANATLTSAQWNASVRDNLNATEVANYSAAGQYMTASAANAGQILKVGGTLYNGGGTDSTNSIPYTTITGGGPNVTLNTGTLAIVFVQARWAMDTIARFAMSHSISGASTAAAADSNSLIDDSEVVNKSHSGSTFTFWNTLTPGSSTFSWNCRVSAGIVTIANRGIAVIPY